MSTTESPTQPGNRTLYIVVAAVLVILMVVGLVAFRSAKASREAEDKADQLIAALEDAGARAPSRDQIVRVLGDDGGPTCDDPNNALRRATLLAQLANGAAGPGSRPVIADSRVFQGQLLIIEIYCPDELDDFQAFIDDLKTDDVAGD
jgi:Tfp pilus assembly protein FimT